MVKSIDIGSLDRQEDQVSAIFKKSKRPVTLKFHDVVYKIKNKNSGSGSLKIDERVILKGITGAVLPGEILALLGPSGSGKTTLLSALGGRLGGDLNGSITYNGKSFSNAMNRNTGFVTQDDKFHSYLTVTETLTFTALLRLPRTLSKQEKIMEAETIITQLGLTKCKNSIMGGPFLRGVSGGERKRVSIGQEILINPSLLFLDEPTSGLDSTSAQQVVSMLWELANGGKTILMSIHQPSSRLFYMFHKVLLLSDGHPLYFGKGEETIMDYFSSIGYTPSVAMNPSDFLVDLANGVNMDDLDMERRKEVKLDLVSAYKNNLADRLKEEIRDIDNGQLIKDAKMDDKQFGKWSTSWFEHFRVLLRRDLKARRSESFSQIKIIQVLTISFISGILWWHSSIANIQDQIGLLFFYCMFWGLLPLFQAVFTFPQERLILGKERSSSMYRLSSYFMAKTLGDLPLELTLPTLSVTITYWMGGLKPTPLHFFKTLIVVLYSVLVFHGIGLSIGAVIMNIRSGTTVAAVLIQSSLLVGGFYVRRVPSFISWAKYISPTHYSFKLLLSSQYKKDEIYPCREGVSCRVESNPTIGKMGLGDEALSFGALTLMILVYRIIAYVSLMKVGVVR